jgi:hypothetical protein
MSTRTPVEAQKNVWIGLLRRLDQMTFKEVPRKLTSCAMDNLSELEGVQSAVQETTRRLLERHAEREDGEILTVSGGEADAYEPDSLVQVGQQQVVLDDPKGFRADRQATLQETATLDLRLVSIGDLDVPLGQLRQSPLRAFVEELQPESIGVPESR